MMTTIDDETRMRRHIDAHFAGRIAPEAERALRAHLPACDGCRAHYENHLLLAELDPRAPDARARLGAGLGLRAGGPAPRRRVLGAIGVVGAAAAAAAVLVVAAPARRGEVDGFAARGTGAGTPAGGGNELRVFRLRRGERPAPAREAIARTDELAFAYRNPARRERLLVFGADEHGHVYWYHPAWSDEADNPVAVVISTAPGQHELPTAILHPLDGRRLDIVGLFVSRPVAVREVEQAIARRGAAPATPLLPDAIEVRTTIAVEP
jgi:hypothetical protein